jgi:hypothetical protein
VRLTALRRQKGFPVVKVISPRKEAARSSCCGIAGAPAYPLGIIVYRLMSNQRSDPDKGESRNAWPAVFIHRLGEIRDLTYENQQDLACGLNLIVTAIILWNT